MKKIGFLAVICLALFVSGCSDGSDSKQRQVITLMTHDSFSVSKAVVAEFESANNADIRFYKAGDAGAALTQAILSKGNPMADVFFGVDNTFLSRALEADIFEAYKSNHLVDIAEELQLDPQSRLLPVDYGDVCLNYDKQWFGKHALAPPESLDDLLKPGYAGLAVVENPATSSPGLAFLLTTVGRYGKDGYLDFWKKFKDNDPLITIGWKEAYWGHFSAASKGDRPIVVSYASSPPAEVHFSEKPLAEPPTAAVTGAGNCFRQIEFVGILKGSAKPDLARKLVDFMLDKTFQEDIPLQMFVFPANRRAQLPEVFAKHAKIAEQPAGVSAEDIGANREKWIEAWTETMLR